MTCSEADPGYSLATPEQHSAYASSYYGSYCGFDSSSNGTLTNERKRASVYLSGTYELTDKVEVYAKVVHLETDTAGTLIIYSHLLFGLQDLSSMVVFIQRLQVHIT